ncbi:RRXRR domain-containing protein [Limnoraphis robusta]|uniref:RRXRR domain-containing protein n=2 Tax=Limnoraphis TaxID=1332112 RepID=A0ABU5TTY6_9CYAN|nr:RRXRR domain-containing protein [Limnoraphis robusta]MEA5518145.1 RRXRR domain-containing protein [Limnoraphis robusta CCNP1315]MEA5543411.1 RRXRR domain-containing protein [Limnoraphis robusta CCNP1324]
MQKENLRVPVVDSFGKPLMPTKSSRARRWIKQGFAKPFWNKLGIWCVQLLVEPSSTQTQDIVIGNDPGKRYSGIAVQSAKYTLFMSHLVLMGFIPKRGTAIAGITEKMSYRAMLRRGRRGRRIDRILPFKLRNHRQKRFSNRKKGKLPPSIRSNRLLEIRVIRELAKIYPVSVIRVERVKADVDKTSGRKKAQSGKGFSPVMVGQNFLTEQLSKIAKVVTIEGWQKGGNGTSQIRKHLNLFKNKEKKELQVPETHAVDAVALASGHFIQYKPFHTANSRGCIWQGKIAVTLSAFKVISKPRITRRRLHDAVPSKGGVRERYGGSTTPFKARKGDLIEYSTKSKGVTKKVIGYCSGYTGKNLSLSDANWSRLGRFANSKCRIIQRNTGLVVSGALNPTQLPSYPPYDQASGYGRSTPEVS